MKIFAAQVNPTVGNIEGNLDKLRHSVMQAEKEKADIAVFPELFITGYPPRDLLSKKWFVQKVLSAIKDIESFSENLNVAVLLGAPLPTEKSTGLGLFNSAVLIRAGKKYLFSTNRCFQLMMFLMKRDILILPKKLKFSNLRDIIWELPFVRMLGMTKSCGQRDFTILTLWKSLQSKVLI